MADVILSSDLIRYNANNRGNRVGDCVKRAISFAFDISYIKIGQELNAMMHEMHTDSYKREPVYSKIIIAHGGSKAIKPERKDMTLNEFADTFNTGTYLVTTGDKPDTHNHLVCVVDGVVYDSWDSRKAYVYSYYTIQGKVHKANTDIKNNMRSLAYEARTYLVEEGQKQCGKYKWEDYLYEVDDDCLFNNYNFTIEAKLTIRFATGLKKFNFPIVFVFSPTTTEEEAHKIVKDTAKVRIYDRMYAVNQKFKEAIDEYEAAHDEGAENRGIVSRRSLWDSNELKFYDSLPGWVKGRLHSLRVFMPGQYSDSYELSLYPLPNHPVEDNYLWYGCISLHSYNAWEMKDMLNRYKEKGEVEGRDYYFSEEY